MVTLSRLVQRIGLSLAAAGLVAGAIVYVSTSSAASDADPVEQQREMRELARLGGTASVQTVKFDQWMSSLWHGQRLAFTLALLGLVVGGACWHVGGLMDEEPLDD
jgi:ABC-type nitrate/sulfonate/bicarbonate transport system permease component